MTSLVYKNTTFTSQLDNIEFIIGQDGKVYAAEASFWPTSNTQEVETPVRKTRKLRGNNGSIASIVRTTFKRKSKGAVLITANSQDTIRKAFINEGWRASISSTNKQNVFEVKRVA
jgi:hypothetical protein